VKGPYGEGMNKLTAETITDEQIRDLRRDAWDDGQGEVSFICNIALGPISLPSVNRNARAHCAALINARKVAP